MAAIKLEAMEAFRAALATALPVNCEIIVGQPQAGKGLCLPSIAIEPTRFRYMPDQEEDYREPDPDDTTVISQVGEHEATVKLSLYTSTAGERYTLEQAVIDLFLVREGSPGVLITPVSGDPDVGDFSAAWELDEEEWHNEMAFDSLTGSVLVVNAIVPALIRRGDVPTQQEIVLAFTEDFGASFPFTPDTLLPPAVEAVSVNEDGSIGPAT